MDKRLLIGGALLFLLASGRRGKMIDITGTSSKELRHGDRPWPKVTRITLHQTDTKIGEKPESWKKLRAHIGVTQGGQIILVHPIQSLVYHGNGTNSSSVGIEVDGAFFGIEGNEKTFRRRVEWPPGSGKYFTRSPSTFSELQRNAVREAVLWIISQVAAGGGKVTEIVAHRQASNLRRPDPGEAIWRDVGVWARDAAGLATPLQKVWGSGAPIPSAWDPLATAEY